MVKGSAVSKVAKKSNESQSSAKRINGTRFGAKNTSERTKNLSRSLEQSRLLYNQPSCYLLEKKTQSILAIGKPALNIIGKEPENTQVVFPIQKGVVYHKERFQQYLLALVDQLKAKLNFGWMDQIEVSCFVPQLATNLDRQIFSESFQAVGIKQVEVRDKAEAIICSVPGFKSSELSSELDDEGLRSKGLVTALDIGDQLTEVVIGSWGKVNSALSLDFGGHIFTNAIINRLRTKHDLRVSQLQAMKLKHQLPSLEFFMNYEQINQAKSIGSQLLSVRGVDLCRGLVVTKNIQAYSIGLAIIEKLPQLTKELKRVFSQLQSEQLLAASENGLFLMGGGSLMMGLDSYLSEEMKVNVNLVNKPLVNLGGAN